MKKSGFTLVELVGVIIILALVTLLAIPSILQAVRGTKEELSDATKSIIYEATQLYVSENPNNFAKKSGNIYCVTLETLTDKEYLPNKVYDSVTGEEIPLDSKIEVRYEAGNFSYNLNNECVVHVEYADNSGANRPNLLDNMIPIRYNGTSWVYADIYQEWYNYDAKQWANAVVLNSGVSKKVGDTIAEDEIALWYVWIPRYTYTIFNGNNESVPEQLIDIKFESGTASSGTVECVDAIVGDVGEESERVSETCTDSTNGSIINGTSTYTHPAFTFGNEELTGFWVGKFEISTTDTTCNTTPNETNCNKLLPITIKPGVSSFRYATIANFFNSIRNIETEYDINGNSHMIKNMEWGAVAYLKQSKYGLGETDIAINNNGDTYYTGGGADTAYKTSTNQSTTGNIYGVYDMSGNAWERVMGNMVNSSGAFYTSSSGFTSAPEDKYYDKYTYNTSYTDHARGKLGDATKETLVTFGSGTGGWYNDYAPFVGSGYSWFYRGGLYSYGSNAGVFYSNCSNGGAVSSNSSRAVLS